jgi:hypothetical protein
VVGRGQRDDFVLARPSQVDPVLARELERCLDRVRAARERVDPVEVARCQRGQLGAQLLDCAVGHRRAADVRQTARLVRHGVGDFGHAVPDVGHEGAAARVEVDVAVRVVEPAPLAANDERVARRQLAEEDVGVGVAAVHA